MKILLGDLESSMDGWEYYAVQATKQQHLQLDKNKILLEPFFTTLLPS